jgi:hypothetical protein
MLLPAGFDDVVARQADQPGYPAGPQGRGNAGGQAAPVVSGEDRGLQAPSEATVEALRKLSEQLAA